MEWLPEQIDELLDAVLPCVSKMQYERALVRFAAKYDRAALLGIDEGDRLIRRRAVRRTDYHRASERASRKGLPFTWVEHRILDWALHKNAERKAEPDVLYIAEILQRDASEVEAEIDRRASVHLGVRGFDI